jgi:hypothetical protein
MLDPSGRHIEDFAEIECMDDDAAIGRVGDFAPNGIAELWRRDRMVERFAHSRRRTIVKMH